MSRVKKSIFSQKKSKQTVLMKKIKINAKKGQKLSDDYEKLEDKKTKGIIEFIKKKLNIQIILLKCLCLSAQFQILAKHYKKTELITHTTVLEQFKQKQKWRKLHPKLAKLQDIWWWIRHGIWQKIEEFPRNIKYFIQRGKRGYSDRDTWSFGFYLATVISGGIDKLIKDVHGRPCDLKSLKQWKSILKKINRTFKTEEKIIDGELLFLPAKKYNDKKRKDIIKFTKENNKEWDINYRVMTKKENREYKEGWKLFEKFFESLWD